MRGEWGTMSVMQKEGHRGRTTGGGTLSAGTEVLRGATRLADFLIYAGGMAYCGRRHGSGHGFFVRQSARGLCRQGSVQQSGTPHGEGVVRQAPWTNKVRKVSSQSAMLEEYVSRAGLATSVVWGGQVDPGTFRSDGGLRCPATLHCWHSIGPLQPPLRPR